MEDSRKFFVAGVKSISIELGLCKAALPFALNIVISLSTIFTLHVTTLLIVILPALQVEIPVPSVLTSREKEDVMEAGVSGMTVMERLESVGISSLVEDDIVWANSFHILVARNNDSNLVSNRDIVTMLVPNPMEPY